MKTKAHEKRAISQIALFVSACFLMGLALHSCQKDEAILSAEGMELQGVQGSEITLDFPVEDVVAGTDFLIAFSSSCGRIMIERGFIEEVDPITGETTCVYSGLDCDADDLMWEEIGTGGFSNCGGGIITQNLSAPGTYVYRAKLNFRAERDADCPDCGDFRGNRFECFTVTVAAENGNGNGNGGTFTDARDERVYKTVTIGTQTWMAENLAFDAEGSYAHTDEGKAARYGRLYTYWQAVPSAGEDICPAGWHLPSLTEWETLIGYIGENPGLYGSSVAKALASKELWLEYFLPGKPWPGSDQHLNNSSGFNGYPAGWLCPWENVHKSDAYNTTWWSSDMGSPFTPQSPNSVLLTHIDQDPAKIFSGFTTGISVRCIKDAE